MSGMVTAFGAISWRNAHLRPSTLTMGSLALVLLVAGGDLAFSRPSPAPAAARGEAARGTPAQADTSLWIEMRNVTLHFDERATVRVGRLHGRMIRGVPGQPAALDDPESFSIEVASGTVALTGEDLTKLLNEYIFAYRGAPLKRLRARTRGPHVVLSGTMHKGVDLPFEIVSTISLTTDGMIKLHPTSTRILGINGQKLLRALGLNLDDMLDLKGSHGASAKGDDVYLDPRKILPPPRMTGTLAAASVQGEAVVIRFAVTAADSAFGAYVRPDSSTPNFVFFRGSQLRFGKLLMDDTDLLIVDADPADPFDLNIKEYQKQLVAGAPRILSTMGLRVAMPDYDDLAPGPSAGQSVDGETAPASRN